MPNPVPQRPARFRRPRLLIIGCGDVGLRVARSLPPHWQLMALSSSPDRRDVLRQARITPIAGNLDHRSSLRRIRALAPWVLHLAPPPGQGHRDSRTATLLATLAQGGATQRLVYASTTGVYGDTGGAEFDESRPTAPRNDRAVRRVDAEKRVHDWAQACGWRTCVLRIPGIYASDRAGVQPRDRVARGTPVLVREDDVYTNHIHADDLARACIAALRRGAPQRTYHVNDDTELLMGDYFDLVADVSGLPRPPRIPRSEAMDRLSPMQLSFMGESRRLINRRLKQELKVQLRYPTVAEGLRDG